MNKLLQTIEEHDIISVFRHVNPDGDALGSQFGVANYIKENYPEKIVYLIGERNDNLSLFPRFETDITDEMIQSSYGIVLDSAIQARIDGPYTLTKGLLNIDHHPSEAPYGDQYIVDSTRSSTCEIVAELLLEGKDFSKETASYLLAGILTDTIRFSVESTKPETLRVAASLMENGASIHELTHAFFTRSYEDFNIRRILSKHVVYEDGLASLIITNEMRKKYDLTERQAKNYGSVMYDVKEFEINVIFVETDEGAYSGSLRSKSITVNDIAAKYHGGGHRLASGFKTCDYYEVTQMRKELLELIKQKRAS